MRGDVDSADGPFDATLTKQISELAGEIQVSDNSPEYLYTVAKQLVHNNYERDVAQRKPASDIVVGMLRTKMINRMDFQNILKDLLEYAEEFLRDLPKMWECLADFFVPPLHERLITLLDVRQLALSSLKNNYEYHWAMLSAILQSYEASHGKYATEKLWMENPLDLSEFFIASAPKATIRQRVADANLTYLHEYEAKETIRQFLENRASNDDVFERIDAYVTDRQLDSPELIRTLTTAVFEHCIHNEKLDLIKMERCQALLQRYLCGKGELELEALYAIQRLMVRLQHPQNLLLTIFVNLEEMEIIMDGFRLWIDPSNPNHEPEGRGVCTKSTTQFFENFSEPEGDDGGKDGDSEDDDDEEEQDAKESDSKETN